MTNIPAKSTPRNDLRDGLRDALPVTIAAVPIGVVFGAIAASKGLSPLEAGMMSTIVFAGGSQFAAIELWTRPVPLLAIAMSTLLVNARHVLMGASLGNKLQRFSWPQKLLAMHVLTDETWALAERRAQHAPLPPAYWLGLGLIFPLGWMSGTLIGVTLGPVLGDPRDYGADFAFTAVFVGLIAGLWTGRTTAAAIIASGVASAITYKTLGAPWHVAIGAACGIFAAYLFARPPQQGEAP